MYKESTKKRLKDKAKMKFWSCLLQNLQIIYHVLKPTLPLWSLPMGHCFLEQVWQVLSSQNHCWGIPQSQSLTDQHDHRNYSLVIVTGVGTHCLRAGLWMSVVTLHLRVGVISLPLAGEGGILQSCLPLVGVWKMLFQIPHIFWSFCKKDCFWKKEMYHKWET